MDTIIAKLNELSDVQAALAVARVDYGAKRTEILNTVQAELDALAAEIQPLIDVSEERIAALSEEIKQEVTLHGASVKGAHLHAVYSKGRVTWDNKGLDRYAVEHPEMMRFRRQGQPTVSLRSTDPKERVSSLED
jgi:phage host-nuclease inhibitor protein Gam